MSMAEMGRVFLDAEVADLYRFRPPYPPAVFEILERLIVAPRVVLDAGAGTGAIARYLAPSVERVDAVDPSSAMIDHGRALPGGDDPRIRWILGRAEDAPLDPPYGLITAGASLHWMDAAVVLPRFRDALAPGARVAVLNTEKDSPLSDGLIEIVRRYSPIKDYVATPGRVRELVDRGLFELEGEERTPPTLYRQSIEDTLSSLHSTSSLSRVTLGERLPELDVEVRELFARHGLTEEPLQITGYVAWGRPR